MTYQSIDAWWWQIAFVLLAGTVATDIWRWGGVLLGKRLDQKAEGVVFVRAVATSLVAAVIAQLIVYPTGSLGEVPLWLRIGAAAIGFAAFLALGQRVWVGVVTGLAVLGTLQMLL